MNKLSLASIAFVALAMTSAAMAGNASGHITHIEAYGNAVIFAVENNPSPAPCATGPDFVVNASTSEGKTMYASLLTAVAADKSISIYSANACPSWWPNSETPNAVTIVR